MKNGKSYILKRSITTMLIAVMLLFIAAVFGTMNTYAAEIARGTCQGIAWTVTDDGAGNVKLTLEGGSGSENVPVIGEASEPPTIGNQTQAQTEVSSRPALVQEALEEMQRWDWLKDESLKNSITSIEISGKIKAQGKLARMFANMPELTAIRGLQNIDVSDVHTVKHLFNAEKLEADQKTWIYEGCPKLTVLQGIEDWDMSNVVSTQGMFCAARGLTELNLSEWNTPKLQSANTMFAECDSLTKVKLNSNFCNENMKILSYLFNDCSSLTTIEGLKNFNTESVNTMQCMFQHCKKLQALDLSSFKTDNMEWMSFAFRGCTKLQNLNLENANTSNVKYMQGAFQDCPYAGSFNLGDEFTTGNVEDMSYMFSGYQGTTITAFDNLAKLDTSSATNMKGMFSNCPNLTSVNLSNFKTSKVTDMQGMFQNCPNLTSLDVSKFDTSNVTNMESMFRSCHLLTSLNLSNFITSNTINMRRMFYDNPGLTSINLSSFNTAKVEDMEGMFGSCSTLGSLDLSNFDTGNVTDMCMMFNGCSGLTKLNLGDKFDTGNVTDMRNMFNACSSLTSLDVSGFNTSNVTKMTAMFAGCSALAELDLVNFDTSKVTDIRIMFRNCKTLKSAGMLGFEFDKVETVEDQSADEILANCRALLAGLGDEITKVDGDTTNYVSGTADKLGEAKTKLDDLMKANPALNGENLINALKEISNYYVYRTAQDNIRNAANAIATAEAAEQAAGAARAKADSTKDTADIKAAAEAGRAADIAVRYAMNQQELAKRNKERAKELTDIEEAYNNEVNEDKLDEIENNKEERNKREAAEKEAKELADAAEQTVSDTTDSTQQAKGDADAVKGGSTIEDLNAANEALKTVEDNLTELNNKKAELEERLKTADPNSVEEKYLQDALKKVNEQIAATETAKSDIETIIAEITGNVDVTTVAGEAEKLATDTAASTQKAKEDADKVKDGSTQADLDVANKALEAANADLNKLKETKAGLEALLATVKPGSAAEAALKDAIAKVDTQIKEAEGTVSHITAIAKAIKDRIDAANIQPGEKFTVAKQNYVVLTVPENGNPEVALVKAKNAKTVTVPKTVAYKGKTCDVTKINKKAFYKKTKKVTVGANVDTIDKQAFKGSKVATVVLKTKDLTKKSVKASLKGSKVKTVQVKVGSKKVNKKFVKKYKKIFTKKNAGKKVTVK